MTSAVINSAPQVSGLFCRSHNANTWEIPYSSQSTAPGNLTQDRAQAQTIAARNGASEKTATAAINPAGAA